MRMHERRAALQVYDVQAASRTGRPIPLRVYEPKGKGPFPVILYFHGGGMHRVTCKVLGESMSLTRTCEQALSRGTTPPTPTMQPTSASTAMQASLS